MAKEYHVSKLFNSIMKGVTRAGVGRSEISRTIGRRSGIAREVPVSPIEVEGDE